MLEAHSNLSQLDAWRDFIASLYPEALTRTYCVPPLHFNRVPYRRQTVPGTGESALVLLDPSGSQKRTAASKHAQRSAAASHVLSPPQVLWTNVAVQGRPMRVQESDFHDDFCQNHVVTNLQALGEKLHEPMFILSQLNFGHFLNKPAYAAAVAHHPLLNDLGEGKTRYSDGEADIIIFHRQHGILICELKSVGMWHLQNKRQIEDSIIADKIQKAVKMLTMSEKVVKHLLSDISSFLTAKKCLFLPYVRSEQLKKLLTADLQLLQAVCTCIGAACLTEVVELCVCADQLSSLDTYWDVNDDVLSKLSTWWRHRMATHDPVLCGPGGDSLYLDIVARFVGPASTVSVHCPVPPRVEVRTAGQAVAELGHRLSSLVLTQQQLDILHRDPNLVFLHGPPGTGKTVLLVLQSLRWLRQGYNVHVVSTRWDTTSSSRLIHNQLQTTMGADVFSCPNAGTVSMHSYDFLGSGNDVDRAVSNLTSHALGGMLCVIVDEVYFSCSTKAGVTTERLMEGLYKSYVDGRLKELKLWCAGIDSADSPSFLQTEEVTMPLRYAPSVLRQLKPAFATFHTVSYFTDSDQPFPGDGPAPIRLLHGTGEGHTGLWPVLCELCGQTVATTLRHLHVGQFPLQWRDVFILTRSTELQDDVIDDRGNVSAPACGLVRGLRMSAIPVCVVGQEQLIRDRVGWEALMGDVATARTDHVTVADSGCVQGLERRVVVWLHGKRHMSDDKRDNQLITPLDRLYIVSRCSTQLVIVSSLQ